VESGFIAELLLESGSPFHFGGGDVSRDENPSVAEIHHNSVSSTKSGCSAPLIIFHSHNALDLISLSGSLLFLGMSLAGACYRSKTDEPILPPARKRGRPAPKNAQSIGR
jgi:hypothetical protein